MGEVAIQAPEVEAPAGRRAISGMRRLLSHAPCLRASGQSPGKFPCSDTSVRGCAKRGRILAADFQSATCCGFMAWAPVARWVRRGAASSASA